MLLMDLLTNVLVICVSSIHSCVAQRTFAIYYSRLNVNPDLDADWEPGEQVMQYAIVSMSLAADDPVNKKCRRTSEAPVYWDTR